MAVTFDNFTLFWFIIIIVFIAPIAKWAGNMLIGALVKSIS